MIMHLGLPNWHYAFTEVGLDNTSQQWFRYFSPERLAIDITNRKKFSKKNKKHKTKDKKERVVLHSVRRRGQGYYTHYGDFKVNRRELSKPTRTPTKHKSKSKSRRAKNKEEEKK